MKSGFVSIIGRPNVGKSTLLNSLLGKKISIISPKSQTTRDAIQGILTSGDEYQIVFVDTPGIHKTNSELGKKMDRISFDNIKYNDIALLLVDSSKEFSESDKYICEKVTINVPLIIVFNKIDLSNVILINKLKDIYKQYFPQSCIIEISALEKFNLDELINNILKILPEGPKYYDEKVITDKDFKFYVEEIIREKILKFTEEEVPHSVCVIADEINIYKSKNIYAKIIVEKESQKGILIGSKGSMIKKIGIAARKDIEEYIGKNINLELVVQVEKDWKNSLKFLNKIGY